ncbi:hypothetical protein [Trichormus azollae]|jgi:hypothetical protein|uniref:hypothetical protein n=1 Tax=Trichormus azollae TaxID=1164 RepID=UPI0001958D45|nr:hypothetical protein [Trichormus azollae]
MPLATLLYCLGAWVRVSHGQLERLSGRRSTLDGWDVVALDQQGTEVEWRGVRLITGYREIPDFMQW